MASPQNGVSVMQGGVRAHVGDLFSKYETPVAVIFAVLFTLIIVFIDRIPVSIRRVADSFGGRIVLLMLTAMTVLAFGWPIGILAALMSALLIGAGGIYPQVRQKKITEGFSPDMNVRLIPTKQRWFVEEVLGENPLLIEDSTIDTSAVQDLSEKYGGSTQSNTVTR